MFKDIWYWYIGVILLYILFAHGVYETQGVKYYSKDRMLEIREKVRAMFQHAYEGYLQYASGYDELRPLTCDGVDTWGSYSLTLIDALDTLATMGNYTEFRRVVKILESMDFDKDINVSVFETNIRIVGGLISAHLLSNRAGLALEPGWPCQGPLLRLAEDVARRLLPAFDTATGMPYGTVNLRYGVPKGETSVTCTAGVGTFLVEFGALSRLTGNSIYEDVALNAIYSLWERRSALGLFGNHIDVQTGRWTALDSGIGAGVDSFFEYLVKGAIMLNRPELMEMFHEARKHIDKHLKKDDWYVWANMNKGQVTLPVFQSLEAFWPGVLSMFGDIAPAMRTLVKYSSVWRKYGFLPEFYNIPLGEASPNREVYPLRPELIESVMYLYRATKNQFLLELGEDIVNTIEFSAKTRCGYATIRNVVTHEKENRMESFYLAETTKYLYLLFDEENFLHNDGSAGDRLQTEHGECTVNAGSYIFNTEAHPVDMSALYCCHDIEEDIFDDLDIEMFNDEALLKTERVRLVVERELRDEQSCGERSSSSKQQQERIKKTPSDDSQVKIESSAPVDINVFDEYDNPADELLVKNFERIRNERKANPKPVGTAEVVEGQSISANHLTVTDLTEFFGMHREDFLHPELALHYTIGFMSNFTLDSPFISGLQLLHKNITAVLGIVVQKEYESRTRTLWELYELQQQYIANIELITRLDILAFDDGDFKLLDRVLNALNQSSTGALEITDDAEDASLRLMLRQMDVIHADYQQALVNTTAMQEFLLKILINGTSEKKRSYEALLNDAEIRGLFEGGVDKQKYTPQLLFIHVRRIVEFKKRMIETFDRLQALMAESGSSIHMNSKAMNSNEANQGANSQKENPKSFSAKSQSRDVKLSEDDDGGGESVWSQLVQTILRKTTNNRNQFNEALLHEKVRQSLHTYSTLKNTSSTAKVKTRMGYEVFTCDEPKFLDRFAYREYYP
ncbi:ER degradation-enhancing alpha-mannosidase-like protein 2 [Anastrepha ludens]|uniref:ER degradation-enhancing alpha-mannosidase-like protein 2 n=1 Tax=Anastrepha ludens TaxID=28586 RepID=UPI0023AEB4C3|nr:ER degradation-enhancing alpha-mannosidase-like protein 2 [Anastrepha ludens]